MSWRHLLLIGLVLGTLALAFAIDPIAQDLNYHRFADTRDFFGVPNFFDVVSNLPFLVVGLLGLRIAVRGERDPARPGWIVLFVGVTLVAFGSSWYHLSPSNGTLVWDRLPMTIGFMGLFVALLTEYINPGLGRLLLLPAVLLGAASVAHWAFSDDLRLYAWVQFMRCWSY